MKQESVVYYVILATVILALVWAWQRWDLVDFTEPEVLQFHDPQIKKDESRFGRDTKYLEVADLSPNELVRFKTRRTGRHELTARVVAIEGQRVKIEKGVVFVNGSEFEDTYKRSTVEEEFMPEMIVPAGCVFVLNDTRWGGGAERFDSRSLGPIPFRAISHRFSPRERRAKVRRR